MIKKNNKKFNNKLFTLIRGFNFVIEEDEGQIFEINFKKIKNNFPNSKLEIFSNDVTEELIKTIKKSKGFKKIISEFEFEEITKKPAVYFNNDFDFNLINDISEESKCDIIDIVDTLVIYQNKLIDYILSSFSIAYWLKKDSSIHFNNFYTSINDGVYYARQKSDYIVTNSHGENDMSTIKYEELDDLFIKGEKIYELLILDDKYTGKFPVTEQKSTKSLNFNSSFSVNNNSYTQALITLQEARANSILPSKIDSYCEMLQGLYALTNNYAENMGEYTSFILKQSGLDVSDVNDTCQTAFNVRSFKSHGSFVNNKGKPMTNEQLKSISEKLDEYCRIVLNELLFNQNFEHFKYDRKEKNDVKRVQKLYKDLNNSYF